MKFLILIMFLIPSVAFGAEASPGLSDWYLPVLALLLAVSEFLSLFPPIKANGVFDLVLKILKALIGK